MTVSDFSLLAADFVITDASRTRRRWEVGGARMLVRVAQTGAVMKAPRTAEAGFWEGAIDAAKLEALAAFLSKLKLETMSAPPVKPAPGAVLRVFAGATGVLAAVPEASVPRVAEAFEAAATGAAARAVVRLELALTPGEKWQGEARLVNAGALPIVVRHPADLFQAKTLVLERAGKPANVAPKAPGPSHVLLAPGGSVAAAFETAPLPGEGKVRLAWNHPAPVLDARFGGYEAPEGALASAEVAA